MVLYFHSVYSQKKKTRPPIHSHMVRLWRIEPLTLHYMDNTTLPTEAQLLKEAVPQMSAAEKHCPRLWSPPQKSMCNDAEHPVNPCSGDTGELALYMQYLDVLLVSQHDKGFAK